LFSVDRVERSGASRTETTRRRANDDGVQQSAQVEKKADKELRDVTAQRQLPPNLIDDDNDDDDEDDVEITGARRVRKTQMPTTLSLLGYRQITIIMTPLYDVYESLQHVINTAYNNDSRQQLVEQQIVIFEVSVDKKQSKAIYNTELTINDTVFELTQIVDYDMASHFNTRFWLSVDEATYLGDASLAGLYFLDALNNTGE
jgi:hypothetical protein